MYSIAIIYNGLHKAFLLVSGLMLYGMHFSGLEKSFACVKRIVSHDKVDVPSQAPKPIHFKYL